MVATTTLVALAAIGGAALVAVAYLIHVHGAYRHSRQSGVVDLHDYTDTRLQILAAEATDELTESATEQVDDSPGR